MAVYTDCSWERLLTTSLKQNEIIISEWERAKNMQLCAWKTVYGGSMCAWLLVEEVFCEREREEKGETIKNNGSSTSCV